MQSSRRTESFVVEPRPSDFSRNPTHVSHSALPRLVAMRGSAFVVGREHMNQKNVAVELPEFNRNPAVSSSFPRPLEWTVALRSR